MNPQEVAALIAGCGVGISALTFAALHFFRGPKEQDAALEKRIDDVRRDISDLQTRHYALAERVSREHYDKSEVHRMFDQINSRITEILKRLDDRD